MAIPRDSQRLSLILLWVFLGGLCVLGMDRPLWPGGEAKQAEIAREITLQPTMIPRFNGDRVLDLPPLYAWLAASSFALAGSFTPASARIVSALAAILLLLLTWRLAAAAGLRELAGRTVFLMATSLPFLAAGHWIGPAALEGLCGALALSALWLFLRGPSPRRATLLTASLVLTFWCSGVAGLWVVAGAGILLHRRSAGEKRGKNARLLVTAALFAITGCAPWFLAAWSIAAPSQRAPLLLGLPVGRSLWPLSGMGLDLLILSSMAVPWLVAVVSLGRPVFWRRVAARNPELSELAVLSAGAFGALLLWPGGRPGLVLAVAPFVFLLLAAATRELAGPETPWVASLPSSLALPLLDLPGLLAVAAPALAILWSRSLWPSYALMLGLGVLAGTGGAVSIRAARWRNLWDLQRMGAALFCMSVLVLLVPLLNLRRDPTPAIRWLQDEVPPGQAVGIAAGEHDLRGWVSFLGERTVVPMAHLAEGNAPNAGWILEHAGPGYVDTDLRRFGFEIRARAAFAATGGLSLWRRRSDSRTPNSAMETRVPPATARVHGGK
ncbi:MAG: ArnT family glycosyltransferase, partial [Acidobacteriota bacterium]